MSAPTRWARKPRATPCDRPDHGNDLGSLGKEDNGSWGGSTRRRSGEKPQLGALVSAGGQQLSAGYHNASVSQTYSRSGRGHNGEKGGGRGGTEKENKEELLG